MMAAGGKSGSLPTGYTAYDWVEANSITGYPHIRTGIYTTSDTKWEFSGSFARSEDYSVDWKIREIFGRDGANTYDANFALQKRGNKVNLICGNYNSRFDRETYAIQSSTTINIGEWHSFVLTSAEGITYGGKLIIDNDEFTYNYNTRGNVNNREFILLPFSSESNGYPCRLGRFIIKYDNTIICDLVPAKRDSDNVVGFYDIVRKIFCTPSTEGVVLLCGNGLENFS